MSPYINIEVSRTIECFFVHHLMFHRAKIGLWLNSFGSGSGLNGFPAHFLRISCASSSLVMATRLPVSRMLTENRPDSTSFSPTTATYGTHSMLARAIFRDSVSSPSLIRPAPIMKSIEPVMMKGFF